MPQTAGTRQAEKDVKALMRRDNAADRVCCALREARREQEGTGT